MDEGKRELAESLAKKDEVEGFLTNLEKLKADGSIAEEHYAAIKEEYEQRLNAAIAEIGQIKDELKKRLAAKRKELKSYREKDTAEVLRQFLQYLNQSGAKDLQKKNGQS